MAAEGLRLLLAAGGTGGHLYPALVVARELSRRRPEAEVIFVGTERGLESRIVPRAGFELELVDVAPLRGGSVFRKLKGLIRIPPAMVESMRLLRRLRPTVVMGVGGYVAGPLLLVAAIQKVPTLILEPNAVPGLTNRWLARVADAAALGWEETRGYFPQRGFVSGNPVRHEIASIPPRPAGTRMRLLVFGGSQGSLVLNRAMLAALPLLRPHRDRLSISHQTGAEELGRVRSAYRDAGFDARTAAYFESMHEEYQACDLALSRAGATTCAELAAAGKPGILVPLPLAGGHQKDNALAMARAGAAEWISQEELTGERLAGLVLELLDQPGRRDQMASRAKTLAKPDAARAIVDRLLELAGQAQPESA